MLKRKIIFYIVLILFLDKINTSFFYKVINFYKNISSLIILFGCGIYFFKDKISKNEFLKENKYFKKLPIYKFFFELKDDIKKKEENENKILNLQARIKELETNIENIIINSSKIKEENKKKYFKFTSKN